MKSLINSEPRKIAIFRALQLGDLLCAIPAVRALKNAMPDSEITLIGLPWAEKFVERFSDYFSGFLKFPGYPGLPEQGYNAKEFIKFLQDAQSRQFDFLIQMHGDGSIINPMIHLLEVNVTAGYCKNGDYWDDKALFMPYPEGLPEIERHLTLMKFLGVPNKGKHLELPVFPEEEEQYIQISKRYKLKQNEYVCIHPGARDTKRWWAPEKFARVADTIAKRGYKVVLTGTSLERQTVRMVEDLMEFPAINLTGKTDLGTLAALIRDAKMVLSNDTGVSHIAAAVKTPSIIIFLASDPKRWAPLDKDLHRIILPKESENLKLVVRRVESVLMDEEDEKALGVEMN